LRTTPWEHNALPPFHDTDSLEDDHFHRFCQASRHLSVGRGNRLAFCQLRYRLTLRDLSEIMLLRGFTVSHESIRQREANLLPVMGEVLRKRRHGTGAFPAKAGMSMKPT
jgi:hypothetical protein